uniref:Uncharacterized protein n=1 Tax=Anguilla anguilla TaxID=7936 RepID=A0A0E9XZE6_ANGAN
MLLSYCVILQLKYTYSKYSNPLPWKLHVFTDFKNCPCPMTH